MTRTTRQTANTQRKSREEILREEIRALRDVGLRLCEWGITLLATLETALWFVRQELRTTMIATGMLDKASPLPWELYLLGTIFLFLVSGIFIMLMMGVSVTSRGYRRQLVKRIESGIKELPLRKSSRRALVFMFLIIPIVDLCFRAVVPSLLAHQAAKMPKSTSQVIVPQIAPAHLAQPVSTSVVSPTPQQP
jgi:hypothetical protein